MDGGTNLKQRRAGSEPASMPPHTRKGHSLEGEAVMRQGDRLDTPSVLRTDDVQRTCRILGHGGT